jgi:[acyl-carrier-protein] S-malonyltransferase
MGKALALEYPVAAAVFEAVDDALGERLSATLWQGSPEEVTLTQNAQPGLMAVSLAVYRVLTTLTGELPNSVAYFAGHSLGEYSALAAAGSIELADAARLLRLRAAAMQRAVAPGRGAMAAIIGLEPESVRRLAKAAADGEICEVANDNGAGQIVLSGHKAAIDRVMSAAKAEGAKRVVLLQVSAPFHSSLMRPAAVEMKNALAGIEISPPNVPVISNVTAAPHGGPAEIRDNLVKQITATVRWRETVTWLVGQGVSRFVELGAGKVLAGLVRRIAPDAEAVSAAEPDDVRALADSLA